MQAMYLPPEDVAYLTESGGGAKSDGRVLVDVHEPEQGHGSTEAFAQTVV